jgi:DNA-binding protein H-NS
MKQTAQALRQKISDLQKRLADLESNKVANIKKVKALMDKLGVTPADLTTVPGSAPATASAAAPATRRRRKRSARRAGSGRRVPVKYQDGQGQTWSGRGKTPRWLVKAEAAGKTRDQFLVKR